MANDLHHLIADLGGIDGAALRDLRVAQAMSTGVNRTWTTPDLPVLPLPHLG